MRPEVEGPSPVPLPIDADPRVVLLCFPPYDRAFARLAQDRLDKLRYPTTADLQVALATIYPSVIVRARDPLATLGNAMTWYVYRDGRYSPFADLDPWWESDDAPWIEIDDAGVYLDANDAALTLLGVDRAGLAQLRSGDLADPAVSELTPWVWDLVRESGELHSTSILAPRGDRPRIAVEYRLLLHGRGPGRSVSWLRQIPLPDAEPTADRPPRSTNRGEREIATGDPVEV